MAVHLQWAMDNLSGQRQIFSVSQLNRRARQLLETHLSLIWVRGEISNLARPSSGHWYFTLKDTGAQVRCAMFRTRNSLVTFKPADGQQVVIRGRVSLYENRGDYQVLVEHLEPDGAGLLQQKFEQLKKRLASEGLFDPARKKPLPPIPRRIGIITSTSGAAIRDILHVLRRRLAMVPITIYPTTVQGSTAAAEIVAALREANQQAHCDLLIVCRGGGSIEDLWPFNEEIVARAIAGSSIPVVSAVGHETDFTIADFAADVRAPTPSAAAEIATPDGTELYARVTQFQAKLTRDLSFIFFNKRQRLNGLQKRLRNPADRLRENAQHLDHLEIRLHRAMSHSRSRWQHQLSLLQKRLHSANPATMVASIKQKLTSLQNRMEKSTRQQLTNRQLRLVRLSSTLDAVSPLGTLHRGYAIPRLKSGPGYRGPLLRSVGEVAVGSKLSLTLRDGQLDCSVEGVEAGHPFGRPPLEAEDL